MHKEVKRYLFWLSIIVIMTSSTIVAKEVNALMTDYKESIRLLDDYFARKEQRPNIEEEIKIQIEEEIEQKPVWDFSNSESTIISESPKGVIENKIREVFPENSEEMIKLFTCESGLDPKKAGDLSLTFVHSGEVLGSSHGIAQIRTGGNDDGVIWNRAEANGMTVKEFIKKLEDPNYNIEYAKGIFAGRGYYAWYNCALRTGLMKE